MAELHLIEDDLDWVTRAGEELLEALEAYLEKWAAFEEQHGS